MPLKGIAINDPIIGDETVQQQVVISGYVDYWEKLMYLNQSFLDDMHELSSYCNYTQYVEMIRESVPEIPGIMTLPSLTGFQLTLPRSRDIADLCLFV